MLLQKVYLQPACLFLHQIGNSLRLFLSYQILLETLKHILLFAVPDQADAGNVQSLLEPFKFLFSLLAVLPGVHNRHVRVG